MPNPIPPTKKMLIVEDDEHTRQQAVAYFEKAGYQTVSTLSGPKALELARVHDFDYIITDYNMVPLNGLDLIAQIKLALPASKAEFIVLSAMRDLDLARRSRALGVRLWMLKPFDGSILNKTLNKLAARDKRAA